MTYGPQAKLNAVISIMMNAKIAFPNVGVGVPPFGIPRQPTRKMETVMIPVVMRRRGRLGSLFARRTAAKTTTTWMI
jgi:hypothetical protein